MNFFVSNTLAEKPEGVSEWIQLLKEEWNDWFTYKTLFSVYYCTNINKPKWLGNLKIGYLNNMYVTEEIGTNTYYSPDIPNSFTSLNEEHFFSLGQDVEYYKSLNELPEDLRVNILKSLNDISFNTQLFSQVRKEDVTHVSLLRSVSDSSVKGQFNRLSNGNSILTPFNFKYTLPGNDDTPLEISVTPSKIPPTNIHVVIGRNGVGKTHLLSNLINYLKTESEEYGKLEHFVDGQKIITDKFANLIPASFSAFDSGFKQERTELIKFDSIGWTFEKDRSSNEFSFVGLSSAMLLESLKFIKSSGRIDRWKITISKLNSDPMFKKYDLTHLIDYLDRNESYITEVFEHLSSGHKIVFLTLTQLIEKVEERSLIVLDEPELHLHPPLISAFIRALSDLLIYRNAIAIIATHSPVILQEVPRSCVSILNRISKTETIIFRRPEVETFGNNVGVLTSSVFNLEVTESGYHTILKNLVEEYESIDEVLEVLDGQLAIEGLSILVSLFNKKNELENNTNA